MPGLLSLCIIAPAFLASFAAGASTSQHKRASSILPNQPSQGYSLVGSSGVAAQMVFLPPLTTKAVFIDNYHANLGGPGYNYLTNTYGPGWVIPGTPKAIFGAEFDIQTTQLRPLHPISNTFCSAGAFWPDGTLMNMGGAEPDATGAQDGFQVIRTYQPGPCPNNNCTQDWVEGSMGNILSKRWYPSAQTLVDGRIAVVGGAMSGGLVTNDPAINNPTYEIWSRNGQHAGLFNLPILAMSANDATNPLKAYNLYPILHLIPNDGGASLIAQIVDISAEVWNYDSNGLHVTLPNVVNMAPRTFPASAMSVLLPIRLGIPAYEATVLMCGGSSGDVPNPIGLDDCWTIKPLLNGAQWVQDDNLPLGGQTMTDGVLLPDGKVLLVNGARKGCAGGFMAEDPVTIPLLYDPAANQGSRFTQLSASTIPRLYHSVAILLPSGKVLIAGSNPGVVMNPVGMRPSDPHFFNYDSVSFLLQQQAATSAYPTEYRVEYFSPPYMSAPSRPIVSSSPASVNIATQFSITFNFNGLPTNGAVIAMLSHPGFTTHGVHMGQRMVELKVQSGPSGKLILTSPPNHSYVPPGFYLLFVSVNGIPSIGQWIQIL